jgi:hypothetical protein
MVALTPKQKQRLYSQMSAGKPAMLSLKASQLGHGSSIMLTKAQANLVDLGKDMKMKMSHAQLVAQQSGQTGSGIFDDVGNWFVQAGKDTKKAFEGAAKVVGSTVLDVVNDPEVKKVLRPLLIQAAGAAGTAGGTALGTALGGVGGPAFGTVGGMAGAKGADALLKQLGYGLRPQAGGALNGSDMVGLDMSPEQFKRLLNVLEASQEYLMG